MVGRLVGWLGAMMVVSSVVTKGDLWGADLVVLKAFLLVVSTVVYSAGMKVELLAVLRAYN